LLITQGLQYIDSRHRKRDLEDLVHRIFDIKQGSEAAVDVNEGDGESKLDSGEKESNIGDDQESVKQEESRPAEDEEMKEVAADLSALKKEVVTLDITEE